MTFKKMITAVDTHAGEPMRVITGGVPHIPGATVLEKMRWLETEGDDLRLMMLREPLGYPAVCCNLIVPPCHPEADAGFIVMEQTEYPPMSGGNTISVATVLLETGILPMQEPVTELTLESPAGLIDIKADCIDGKVVNVTFENVPAFSIRSDVEIDVKGLGKVTVDVAWGGMFYVIADANQFDGLTLDVQNGRRIRNISSRLTAAAAEQIPVVHPENPDFKNVTISLISGPPTRPETDLKNAVTVATGPLNWDKPETWTGALDRCPCGTGTCAKMAALYAKGELQLNQDFKHEGLLGTIFTGRLIRETKVGHFKAVVPTLSGQSWITGFNTYVLDPSDPFPEGFRMGDIWPM
jgi:proline racemase